MKRTLTIYQSSDYLSYYPNIRKKVIEYDDSDKDIMVIIKDDYVNITYIGRGESMHNGSSYNEYEVGWLTFNKCKANMLKTTREKHKKEIEQIKSLKERK